MLQIVKGQQAEPSTSSCGHFEQSNKDSFSCEPDCNALMERRRGHSMSRMGSLGPLKLIHE